MNKIHEVKERANIIKVAQYFNLQLNRANKCNCPFHTEKTASFSINEKKQIWKCFGCGKGGDVISLVSELLNVNAYKAASFINEICYLGIDFDKSIPKYEINKYKQKQKAIEEFKKWENNTFQLLCDYFHSLCGIKKYNEQDKVEYYIDLFIEGTNKDKIWFKQTKERWCSQIARELGR